MSEKVTVELTQDEAESFLQWRQHQDKWDILIKAGVFAISNGSAQLHFNSMGQIASIDTHFLAFKRINVVIPNPTQNDRLAKESS